MTLRLCALHALDMRLTALQTREQGQPLLGRVIEQQDPSDPAQRLRLPRRGLSQAQDHRQLPAAATGKREIAPTLIREDPEILISHWLQPGFRRLFPRCRLPPHCRLISNQGLKFW